MSAHFVLQPLLLFLLTYLLVLDESDGLTCTVVSGDYCSCTLGDGVDGSIDISPLFVDGDLHDDKYYYNGCSGVTCAGNPCSSTCAGCQHDGDGYGMGSLSTITFNMEQSIPKENKWTLVANYTGGADGRQFNAIIEYDPSTTTPSLHYISEEPRLHYHLAIKGSFTIHINGESTPATGVEPGIAGLVLILVLLLAIVSYVVIGIGVNAGIRHKRGIEMIPNVEFWKDFPFLLKDGVVFTFTFPCKKIKERRFGYQSM